MVTPGSESQEWASSEEAPTVPVRPAGLGVRFAARIIDSVIVAIVMFCVLSILGLRDDVFVLIGLTAAVTYGYFVLCESTWGATLGKRLLGLRVTGPATARPSVGQSATRNAFLVVSAIPFLGGVVDLALRIAIAVTIAKSSSKQGLHDRWAGGTQVQHTS